MLNSTFYPSSPEEAGAYVRTLQAVLRAMGSSDGNMEQVIFILSRQCLGDAEECRRVPFDVT